MVAIYLPKLQHRCPPCSHWHNLTALSHSSQNTRSITGSVCCKKLFSGVLACHSELWSPSYNPDWRSCWLHEPELYFNVLLTGLLSRCNEVNTKDSAQSPSPPPLRLIMATSRQIWAAASSAQMLFHPCPLLPQCAHPASLPGSFLLALQNST